MEKECFVLFFLDEHVILDPERSYSIGRDKSNDIVLPHSSVSRFHLFVEWKKSGFTVRDRSSTNGTFVDDNKIAECGIGDRSRIRAGVYTLELRIIDRKTLDFGVDVRTPGGTMILEGEFAKLARVSNDPALTESILNLKKFVTKKNRKMSELVNKDGLTGLFNRRYFDKALKTEFDRAMRYERHLSLIMIDIDKFKSINDRFGHPKGDIVLTEVARLVVAGTRKNDIVARYGGEEICVLIPETPIKGGIKVAEKIRDLIESGIVLATGIKVTVSCGVAAANETNDNFSKLLKAADTALYQAKTNGRNCVLADKSD